MPPELTLRQQNMPVAQHMLQSSQQFCSRPVGNVASLRLVTQVHAYESRQIRQIPEARRISIIYQLQVSRSFNNIVTGPAL